MEQHFYARARACFQQAVVPLTFPPRGRTLIPSTSMGDARKDQLLGKLDLLILRVLAPGERMHGYAIAGRIQLLSENVLEVGEGSLYPALHRIEESGWIRSAWKPSENNRRARFYRITAAGRRRLAQEQADWERAADAIARVLRRA